MALTKIRDAALPAGSVLQVQYTQFTGTNSVSFTSDTDTILTDLTVNITPISTSSIIRIDAMVNGEWSNQSGATDSAWFFFRDSTKLSHPVAGSRVVGIAMGNAVTYANVEAGSSPELIHYSYFDLPSSISQITYKVAARLNGAYTWYLNRTVTDTDGIGYERGVSYISVTEIAG